MNAKWHEVDARTEEGDIEWRMLRLGKLGSSEFSSIVTPKKLELSTQARKVMYRILAERITGMPVENENRTEWMDRGVELEDQAVRAYEGLTDTETTMGGIFIEDNGVICCSPDRLVGTVGDCEVKAPLIHTQIGYALEGLDEAYKLQLQGRMMIHGREWVDIFSYHPLFSIPPLRVVRDEKVIKVLRTVLDTFVAQLLEAELKLTREYGPFAKPEPPPAPDHGADAVTHAEVDELVRLGAIQPQHAEECRCAACLRESFRFNSEHAAKLDRELIQPQDGGK